MYLLRFQRRVLLLLVAFHTDMICAYHTSGKVLTPPYYGILQHRCYPHVLRSKPLWMKGQSPKRESNNSAEMRKRGIYSRPSAAIEKGSGFYVPGLEGYRVRILVAVLVLSLNYVNRIFLSSDVPTSTAEIYTALQTSQLLTNVFATILLLQGLVEFRKEILSGSSDMSEDKIENTSNTKEMNQITSITLQGYGSDAVDAVRWATASFVAMTTTTHIILIQMKEKERGETDTEIIYRLGNFSLMNETSQDVLTRGMEAAMKTVFDSVGGRVRIGPSHPAALLLLPEPFRRCVLLQRIDRVSDCDDSAAFCLMTGSNNILESYTKNDLKWLGQLAQYLALNLHFKS